MKDKYSAMWLSYSSITDYLKCPRAYFLKNLYRDPKTNRKITLMQPPLALGQIVHDVFDEISSLPQEDRLTVSLVERLEKRWDQISGKRGGFHSDEEEQQYKERAISMVTRAMQHPGPLKEQAIKIRLELPYFWLSEKENIILCGKIDWLEYIKETDSVRILDFKTGKFDEDPNSLQLPIYYLLVVNCQSRAVSGARYWYLNRDNAPLDVPLPKYNDSLDKISEVAKQIGLARKLERFVCKQKKGCRVCSPYETIVAGKAEYVGLNSYSQDIYIL